MTSTQIESFVTLVVASGVVIVLVLVGGPALARLLFRFRLEAVHDAAVDAVLERRLRPERPVTIFTEDVDRAAEHPHWVTLARGGAMLRALKDLGVEDPTKLIPQLSYSELEPSERKIMHELEQRTFSAFRSYLIWGSPLGWALAPLVFLIHFHPGRKFTKTDQAVPAVARGAMCGDTGVYRKATRWASGSGSYASR